MILRRLRAKVVPAAAGHGRAAAEANTGIRTHRRAAAMVGVAMVGAVMASACAPVATIGQGHGTHKTVSAGHNPIGTTGKRSGLGWNSGIWGMYRSGSVQSYNSALSYAEDRRGRRADVNMSAQYATNWKDLTGMQILDFLNGTSSATSIVMLPPWPDSGGSWSAAASGAYDSYYRQIGAQVAAIRPNAKTVLRFAWEANGDWYPWSIVNRGGGASNFVNGWRHAVNNMRAGAGSKASNIVIDYSLSNLDDKGQGDPLSATYPGDKWVDVIGIDAYDDWQVTRNGSTPAKVALLNRAYNFAVAHGKWVSVDEWGLHHTNSGHAEGGDNPAYISAMYNWIKTHRSRVAWETYFQDDAMNNVNSALFSPRVNNNPASSQAYRARLR